MLLPLVLVPAPRPGIGEARVQVLDVGQGLAVHVQTATHDLLYDAGPAFSADANSGNRIIVPYLRAMGVQRLDAVVISHQDKDHEGGAEAVLDQLPTALLLTSLPADHELASQPAPHRSCVDGDGWSWDEIQFRILHPTAEDYRTAIKTNDLSCVLRIASATGSVLLTGDLEARNESALVARHGTDLASDVVVPPHHGSRGSSTPAFVSAVGARQVVFSAGYRNRFGHPAAEVAARYSAVGADLHRTDGEGAVCIDLGQRGIDITAERLKRRRYWFSD
jgi:competence protein ComEC